MCERHVTVMTLSSRHNLVFHKSNRPFLGNSSRTDHINAIDTITHLNRFVYDNNILYYYYHSVATYWPERIDIVY